MAKGQGLLILQSSIERQVRERPKTLSPLWGREAGIFLVSLSFPLISCHSGLFERRLSGAGPLRLRFSALRTGPLRRGSGQALRLRFSALRMRGGIIGLTIIIVERWHPEWEGGKCQYVSCCCHRRRRDRRLCGCTKNNQTGEGKLKDPARRCRTIVKSFNTVESAFNPTFAATPEIVTPAVILAKAGTGIS